MSSYQNKIIILNKGQNKEISLNVTQFVLLQKHSSVIECCIDKNIIYLHSDIDIEILNKIIVLLEIIENIESCKSYLSRLTKKELFSIANMCFYFNIQVILDIICTQIAKEIKYFNEIELENYFKTL
jgi:hypothetical protein